MLDNLHFSKIRRPYHLLRGRHGWKQLFRGMEKAAYFGGIKRLSYRRNAKRSAKFANV